MSSTPSISISKHQRYHDAPTYPLYASSASLPMAVPLAQEPVPPPLPPPKYLPEIYAGQDPGWQWGNDPNGSDFGRPVYVRPGSSLLGGAARCMRLEKEHDSMTNSHFVDARRGSSISTVTLGRDHEMPDETPGRSDEDGMLSRQTSNGLQSERQLEQRTLEESSQTYDKQLLSRIGGPNTPIRQSVSYSPVGGQENNQLGSTDTERRHASLRPLSMPDSKHKPVESPSSSRLPSSGGISPGNTAYWHQPGPPENSRVTANRHTSVALHENGSQRGSYDHAMFISEDFYMDDGQMSGLHLHDRSPRSPQPGSKRRASSPARDPEERLSISSASGHGELPLRLSMQQLPSRASPVSRFHPNHSSLSSASSFGPRHGSLGSSLGLASVPSSATSYGSGRVSPSSISSAIDQDLRLGKAFTSPIAAPHQRTFSESSQSVTRKPSTDTVSHSRNSSLSMPGTYICECCPKKPRKFMSDEGLRAHESEKQYTCAYCPNRFKNKNEAERHQNSLHLRRHSWSCAALAGIEAAFHATSSGNGTDVCGFCGEEFPNPPQWDIRAEHLNLIHKFRECNQTKKFFRADHFRQHLKHSHQGTSGKWTNMLENACMKDEPPPEKRAGAATIPALMVTTTGLSGSDLSGAGTVDESSCEDSR